MNKKQEESLFFYARNDYLIINNLLVDNVEKAIGGYKLAYQDGHAMMKEALDVGFDKRWGVSKEQGQEIFDWYKKRYPAILDEQTIQTAIERAFDDFKNIVDCMSLSTDNMVLYRNINTEHALKDYIIGQKIELKTLLSTSINIYEKSFWGQKTFERYILNIPKGTPMVIMSTLPQYITNEADEVLLPPMEVEIKNVKDGYGNCQKIVELNFVKLIK